MGNKGSKGDTTSATTTSTSATTIGNTPGETGLSFRTIISNQRRVQPAFECPVDSLKVREEEQQEQQQHRLGLDAPRNDYSVMSTTMSSSHDNTTTSGGDCWPCANCHSMVRKEDKRCPACKGILVKILEKENGVVFQPDGGVDGVLMDGSCRSNSTTTNLSNNNLQQQQQAQQPRFCYLQRVKSPATPRETPTKDVSFPTNENHHENEDITTIHAHQTLIKIDEIEDDVDNNNNYDNDKHADNVDNDDDDDDDVLPTIDDSFLEASPKHDIIVEKDDLRPVDPVAVILSSAPSPIPAPPARTTTTTTTESSTQQQQAQQLPTQPALPSKRETDAASDAVADILSNHNKKSAGSRNNNNNVEKGDAATVGAVRTDVPRMESKQTVRVQQPPIVLARRDDGNSILPSSPSKILGGGDGGVFHPHISAGNIGGSCFQQQNKKREFLTAASSTNSASSPPVAENEDGDNGTGGPAAPMSIASSASVASASMMDTDGSVELQHNHLPKQVIEELTPEPLSPPQEKRQKTGSD